MLPFALEGLWLPELAASLSESLQEQLQLLSLTVISAGADFNAASIEPVVHSGFGLRIQQMLVPDYTGALCNCKCLVVF